MPRKMRIKQRCFSNTAMKLVILCSRCFHQYRIIIAYIGTGIMIPKTVSIVVSPMSRKIHATNFVSISPSPKQYIANLADTLGEIGNTINATSVTTPKPPRLFSSGDVETGTGDISIK